jgi:hypothetical protein
VEINESDDERREVVDVDGIGNVMFGLYGREVPARGGDETEVVVESIDILGLVSGV